MKEEIFQKKRKNAFAFFPGSRVVDPCSVGTLVVRSTKSPPGGDFAFGAQLTQLDRGRTESPARIKIALQFFLKRDGKMHGIFLGVKGR